MTIQKTKDSEGYVADQKVSYIPPTQGYTGGDDVVIIINGVYYCGDEIMDPQPNG